MSLVTEKTKENAKKCEECPLMLARESLQSEMKKNEFVEIFDLKKEASVAVKGFMKMTCNVCPYRESFEAVYGEKPYNYFIKK